MMPDWLKSGSGDGKLTDGTAVAVSVKRIPRMHFLTLYVLHCTDTGHPDRLHRLDNFGNRGFSRCPRSARALGAGPKRGRLPGLAKVAPLQAQLLADLLLLHGPLGRPAAVSRPSFHARDRRPLWGLGRMPDADSCCHYLSIRVSSIAGTNPQDPRGGRSGREAGPTHGASPRPTRKSDVLRGPLRRVSPGYFSRCGRSEGREVPHFSSFSDALK